MSRKKDLKGQQTELNEQKVIDWVQIKAEYISGTMSASKLAEKHGVSVYAIRKRSGKERWQELRKQNQRKTANQIAKKINTEKVKKTATAEEEYRYDYAKRKTLVNTKRAAEISKSLLNVRDILADYTTEQDEENALGIIEIPMQEVMQPPEDDEQDGESVE